MSHASRSSSFAAAVGATASQNSNDTSKTRQQESAKPKDPSQPSSSTSNRPLWKGLRMTSAKRKPDDIEFGTNQGVRHRPLWKGLKMTSAKRKSNDVEVGTNRDVRPTKTFASIAARTQRKVFSTGFFYGKKLKRFQNDSPSSPSRSQVFSRGTSKRNNATDVNVVDLCSSDDDDEDIVEKPSSALKRKDPPLDKASISSKRSSNDVGYGVDSATKVATLKTDAATLKTATAKVPSLNSMTFSADQKRSILEILAPKSLPPEVILHEKWKEADYLVVSSTFAKRFGCLEISDLEKLAKGDVFVPKGMVYVKEVLRDYRISLEQAQKPSVEKKTIETAKNKVLEYDEEPFDTERHALRMQTDEIKKPTISVDADVSSKGVAKDIIREEIIEEEMAQDKEIENEVDEEDVDKTKFQWNGTFMFLQKDKSEDTVDEPKNAGLQKDDTESKFNVFKSQHVNDDEEELPRSPPSEQDLNENQTQGDKEKRSALREDSLSEDKLDEPKYTREAEVSMGEGSQEEISSKNIEKTHESKNSFGDNGLMVGGQKEVDDAIMTNIVEYKGDEEPVGQIKEQSELIRETQDALSNIITNVVDVVTTRSQQEQEQQEGEVVAAQGILKLIGSSDKSPSSTIPEKEEEQVETSSLIVVSAKQLLLLALPLICLAGIFRLLGLFDVSSSIIEGCFRTFIQLHILGWLLSPIFKYGIKHPGLVGCYALFMIILASYEASSRTKYTHDDQFKIIVQSLVLNVGWVASWAFGMIVKPRPAWNPRYLLPIVGMLLGNSINGISITLDTITTSLVEKQSEVELYLSFGANQYEAVSGIVANAIQKGATPSLNMMCVVGIVSIPGMMTGQILGGSSPIVAARYQAMIIFLIAMSVLSTILLSSGFTVMSAFCSHQILRQDRFVKNRKRGLASLILWLWGYLFGGKSDLIPGTSNGIAKHDLGLFGHEANNTLLRPSVSGFQILPLKKGSVVSDGEGKNSLVQASGLNRFFELGDEIEDIESTTQRRRVLFQDISFQVNEGDLLFISGPSGTGKSQLLRMMAGLSPLQDGDLRLEGKSWKDEYSGIHAVDWRRQIRYVAQTKIQIPGTPLHFIKKIQSFQSWKVDEGNSAFTELNLMKHISHHIRRWGMDLECLDKEWSILSGGESQRILMAIALASRPKILLFDESTSALDYDSKLSVEESIKDFVEDHEGGVLWVSHDGQQAERMMDES